MKYTKVKCTNFLHFQTMAHSLIEFACADYTNERIKGLIGYRSISDPVVTEICMNLHVLSKKQDWYFSSCTYMPMWVYECLGITDKQLLRSGKADNPLTRLVSHKCASGYGIAQKKDFDLEVGDLVHIGSNGDSHVQMLFNYMFEREYPGVSAFGTYGQGFPTDAKLKVQKVYRPNDSFYYFIGERPLRNVLRLRDLYEAFGPEFTMRVPEIVLAYP